MVQFIDFFKEFRGHVEQRRTHAIFNEASTEAKLWDSAQNVGVSGEQLPSIHSPELPDSPGPRCFIDGSWKKTYIFSGLG